MRWIVLLAAVIIALISGLLVSGWGGRVWLFIERTEPEIVKFKFPAGIGIKPSKGAIVVADAGAGIRSVSLVAHQGDIERELIKLAPERGGAGELRVNFALPGSDGPFSQGEVDLKLTVTDRSVWKNTVVAAYKVPVDFNAPRVDLLTTQHNVAQGGVGLTFFKVAEDGSFKAGVKSGSKLFKAYPAVNLGQEFGKMSGMNFSFFAHPLVGSEAIEALVQDVVGNTASLKLPALVLKKSYPAATTDLSEAFLARVVPLLLPEYQKLAREMGRQYKKISPEDLVEGFRIINEDYRKLLDLVFERIFAQTEQKRLWNGAFQRPLAGAPTAPFGESRTYLFQGRAVSASMHTGVDLASIEHDPIVAANSGRVAFAGFLGIYGDAVVIDHGLGLFTLYGHLSSVDCRVGKMLDAGDVLGKTGMTGLAGGDHLHYEVRLDGVPVRPLEWWDAKWINDHIEQKIAEMKKMVD